MSMIRDYSEEHDVYSRTVRSEQIRYYRGLRYSVHIELRRAVIPGSLFSTMTGSRRHVYACRTYAFSDEPLRFFVNEMRGEHFFGNKQVLGTDEEFANEARAYAAMIPANAEPPF